MTLQIYTHLNLSAVSPVLLAPCYPYTYIVTVGFDTAFPTYLYTFGECMCKKGESESYRLLLLIHAANKLSNIGIPPSTTWGKQVLLLVHAVNNVCDLCPLKNTRLQHCLVRVGRWQYCHTKFLWVKGHILKWTEPGNISTVCLASYPGLQCGRPGYEATVCSDVPCHPFQVLGSWKVMVGTY